MVPDETVGKTCALVDARQFYKNAGTCQRVSGAALSPGLGAVADADTLAKCKKACFDFAGDGCKAYQWASSACHLTADVSALRGNGDPVAGECWTEDPAASAPFSTNTGHC